MLQLSMRQVLVAQFKMVMPLQIKQKSIIFPPHLEETMLHLNSAQPRVVLLKTRAQSLKSKIHYLKVIMQFLPMEALWVVLLITIIPLKLHSWQTLVKLKTQVFLTTTPQVKPVL